MLGPDHRIASSGEAIAALQDDQIVPLMVIVNAITTASRAGIGVSRNGTGKAGACPTPGMKIPAIQ
jgi:hypothetical protein